MIHISSEDVASGNTYDGIWDLSSSITGTLAVKYHFIDADEIPWTYTGCKILEVRNVGSGLSEFVNLGQISDTSGTLTTTLENAFNALTFLSSVTVSKVGDEYLATAFDVDVDILWTSTSTSADLVFAEKVVDETVVNTLGTLAMKDTFVDNRPNLMELHIAETSSSSTTSRSGGSADLFIPTNDFLIEGAEMSFSEAVNRISLSWRRVNIPSFPCPMPNRWDLVMV